MRRLAMLSLVALLSVAACGQKAANGGEGAKPAAGGGMAAVFPNLFQTNFRAEATVTGSDEKSMPVVMIRSGHKLRMELTNREGEQIMIMNPDDHEMLMIGSHAGQRMALRVPNLDIPDPTAKWQGDVATHAHATGPCMAAGEMGTRWEGQDDDGKPVTACVTGDGVILNATNDGRTVWETTHVTRGPQDPALFAAPAGVRVMNLGPGAAAALSHLERRKP